MQEVRVLRTPAAIEAALDPIRSAILNSLDDPASATTIAASIGSTRQKVNYHLRALEDQGLVELAEERPWGGITERVVRRSARRFIVTPEVLDSSAADPDQIADRSSAAYLIALAARSVSEVGSIVAEVDDMTRIPTLSIDTEIGFRSAQDRSNFAAELQSAIATLAARYHHDGGRPYRVVASSYPRPSGPASRAPHNPEPTPDSSLPDDPTSPEAQ